MFQSDEQLNRILSDYAEQRKPDPRVLERAKAELYAKNVRKQSADVRRHKRERVGAVLAAVCACLFVGVFAVGMLVNLFNRPHGTQPSYYSQSQLTVSASTIASASREVDLAWLTSDDMMDVAVTRYAFKSNDATAYYRVRARLSNGGDPIDLECKVEVTEMLYRGFDQYRSMTDYKTLSSVPVRGGSVYKDGEYVGTAYFELDDTKYYLDILTPDATAFDALLARIIQGGAV